MASSSSHCVNNSYVGFLEIIINEQNASVLKKLQNSNSRNVTPKKST